MPHLDLSDNEAAALIKALHDTVDNDRYPFSEHIRTLKAILAKFRPAVRELLRRPRGSTSRRQEGGIKDRRIELVPPWLCSPSIA